MRPKSIYSSKKTRRARDPVNIRKQRKKYPKVIEDVLKASEIVLIVIDARFLKEMYEEDLQKELLEKKKEIVYVINKADLLKEKIKDDELKKISNYVLTSCTKRRGIGRLRNKIKQIAKKVKKEERVSVGVIGYPNTGKSSVINQLIGKSSAKTGIMPGFTKSLQKLRLTKDIMLIDSPGVIPLDKYSNSLQEKINFHTKINVRHYSRTKNPELVLSEMMKEMPGILEKHYEVITDGDDEFIEELGKRLHFFKKGGVVDEDRVARKVLKDWQEGKINSHF